MLIGRERELAGLERKYRSDRAELIVLYGRRRVGKTALIREFIQDKPHLYFAASLDSEARQLSLFSQMIRQAVQPQPPPQPDFTYPDWREAFLALAQASQGQRWICAIDEYPYLVGKSKRVATQLQNAWDAALEGSRVFLILCGSYLSVMQQHFLNRDAPLHGRRTGRLHLQPLDLPSAAAFLPDYDPETVVQAFACAGGMPSNLQQFRSDRSLWANVRDSLLTPLEFLYDEAHFVLTDELREPRHYFAILRSIASGAHQLKDILRLANLTDRNAANYYLDTLVNLGILVYRRPVGPEPDSRRWGQYHIADPYFRFWFRWVLPFQHRLEMGLQDEVLEQEIRPQWSRFVAEAWEQLARDFLVPAGAAGYLPFVPEEVGKWWSGDREIDVIGVDRTHRRAVLGEARWQYEPMGMEVLTELFQKKEPAWLGKARDWRVDYALFSRSGFTAELQALAEHQPEVHLFTPQDLVTTRESNP